MRRYTRIAPAAVALATCFWSVAANSAVVYLDQFEIKRNGGTFFTDGFGDGSPPPSAPNFPNGQPAAYSVFGTFVAGSEASGLLRLNSADGGLTQNANGQDRRTLRAALNTNTVSSDLTTGLKIDDTLGLTGLFNLSSLTGPLINGYGIRFSDRTSAGANQAAELDVRFNPVNGKIEVRYILQDFEANQVSERGLADFTPPNGADQILLRITRPDTGFDGTNYTNTNFFASYSYLQGGNVVGGGVFETPISLFQGENFVRAEFHAFESLPVPEPGTLALLGLGFAGMAAMRRRRQ
jgi:hypothetical protein